MKNIINRFVFFIYEKSKNYLLNHDVVIETPPLDYDYDFWGFTND